MSRELNDWVEAYLKYHENTESAREFHEWVAYSMIASVLRKKVYLSLGRLRIYPNMYIVLTANPGHARKSQAIDFGLKFLTQIEGINTSADAITKEALLQDLETCAIDTPMPDGSMLKHASLSIISKEFESFLGNKTDNAKMVVLLTDLFDCSELPWKYRTKNSGTNVIPSLFLNLLAATTPDSLASQLPAAAIGGGLTSRVLFVWAAKKQKKVPIPVESVENAALKLQMIADLQSISEIVGVYEFTKESREFWINWYEEYEEDDPKRLCPDTSFNGWYSRKPMYILKLVQGVAAARSANLDVTVEHLQKSISLIESVEENMGRAFKAVGRSAITAEVSMVIEIIKSYNVISEKHIMSIVWRDMDAPKFQTVIDTAKKTGMVDQIYTVPLKELSTESASKYKVSEKDGIEVVSGVFYKFNGG